jgi:hypothetical protein
MDLFNAYTSITGTGLPVVQVAGTAANTGNSYGYLPLRPAVSNFVARGSSELNGTRYSEFEVAPDGLIKHAGGLLLVDGTSSTNTIRVTISVELAFSVQVKPGNELYGLGMPAMVGLPAFEHTHVGRIGGIGNSPNMALQQSQLRTLQSCQRNGMPANDIKLLAAAADVGRRGLRTQVDMSLSGIQEKPTPAPHFDHPTSVLHYFGDLASQAVHVLGSALRAPFTQVAARLGNGLTNVGTDLIHAAGHRALAAIEGVGERALLSLL